LRRRRRKPHLPRRGPCSRRIWHSCRRRILHRRKPRRRSPCRKDTSNKPTFRDQAPGLPVLPVPRPRQVVARTPVLLPPGALTPAVGLAPGAAAGGADAGGGAVAGCAGAGAVASWAFTTATALSRTVATARESLRLCCC